MVIPTITRKLEIEVMEGFEEPTGDPSMGGGSVVIPAQGEESTIQKIWRFILGLFGLDSALPANNDPGIMPEPEMPFPGSKPGSGGG